jgi:hypothetical protein
MTPSLPSRPDLAQVRRRAKELLKAHRSGDPSCCETLRHLGRFADADEDAILSADLNLSDAQHALAKSYGFATWADLRQAVEGRPGAAESAPRQYRYVAVDQHTQSVPGVLSATDFDDFAHQVKDLGMIAVSVDVDGPDDIGVQTVLLVLYQLVLLGWAGADFHCGAEKATFNILVADDSQPGTPFPTEAPGDAVLAVLREMSGDPELGRRTSRVRSDVRLGGELLHPRPRMVSLRFASDAAEPDSVKVTVCLPGSDGPLLAPEDYVVDRICDVHAEKGSVHVLTSQQDTAERLAAELCRRLGAANVGLVAEGGETVPEPPLIVSTAADMCFAYMRACWSGPEARDAMERELLALTAVCVNVSRQDAQTPCEFHDSDGNVTEHHRIAPFLMLYGCIVEYGAT